MTIVPGNKSRSTNFHFRNQWTYPCWVLTTRNALEVTGRIAQLTSPVLAVDSIQNGIRALVCVLIVPFMIQFTTDGWEGSTGWTKDLGPCTCGRTRAASWLLASDWLSLAIVVIGGINRQKISFSASPSFCNFASPTKINTS